ncbi:hypothetical protein [Spiroplasma endosymbiont of Tipula paludosa]|uniref:hypothetical protein n=1 Tax=Spiroplasma endosymbiont of Tipula paludosa TaxID=3066295 RepID=UPI0035C8F971
MGGILDSDYEKAANFIWEHFSHFNEKLCDLINSNFYTYIFVETDRNEKWDENKIILV